VSLPELQALWKKASEDSYGKVVLPSEQEIKQLFVAADKDRDTFLSEEEFEALLECVYAK
jgi:Ca2+-binding EF-hand superfamily protein